MLATTSPPKRSFVPQNLNVADWSQIEPLCNALLDRAINSPTDLEKWLLDVSELSCVLDEYGTRRHIDKSCHTDDPEIEKAFLHYVENIEPKFKPLFFRMQKQLVDSPHRAALKDKRYEMLTKHWRADVEIFREQNVPLEVLAVAVGLAISE